MGLDDDYEERPSLKEEQAKLLNTIDEAFTPSTSENFTHAWQWRERHWIYRYTHVWAVTTLTLCVILYVAWLFGAHPWSSHNSTEGIAAVRKGIILSSYSSQNTAWMNNLAKDWEIYKYYMDRPDAAYHVPRNFGREVMTYTTYIIDHYDSLPDYMIFTHGHERSWHQAEPIVWKINALNYTALDQDHYVSLRCNHSPTCHLHNPIDLTQMQGEDRVYVREIPRFWRYAGLGEYLEMGKRLPTRLSSPCCAQFAVTKTAVLRRSREWWKRYRSPLLKGDVFVHDRMDTWDWGMMYEKLWHVAFGMHPFHCPPERYCFETQWSNAIHCDGYPTTPLWGLWGSVWRDITCWKNTNDTHDFPYLKWTNRNYTGDMKPKKHNVQKPPDLEVPLPPP